MRPIVPTRGGIFDRLGWFLQHLLKPLLKHVSAHLNSTTECIQRMEKVDSDQLAGMIPAAVSFDFVSLYTNVDTWEAITTALEYIIKYKMNCLGLNTGDIDIWVLLHTLLDNNVFACEDVGYFQQIRGLAIGNRVSGTLAILAMDKFERLLVYQELLPLVYVRYVDDVGTVVKNQQEAENTLEYLEQQISNNQVRNGAGRRFSAPLGHGGSNRRNREFQRKLFNKESKTK